MFPQLRVRYRKNGFRIPNLRLSNPIPDQESGLLALKTGFPCDNQNALLRKTRKRLYAPSMLNGNTTKDILKRYGGMSKWNAREQQQQHAYDGTHSKSAGFKGTNAPQTRHFWKWYRSCSCLHHLLRNLGSLPLRVENCFV